MTFTASATADAPASFEILSGNNQTATTGTSVATAPAVVIRDQFDNPVAGQAVDFSASGGGSVGSSSVTTNSNGRASTSWTVSVTGHAMGSNGTFQNTLTASTNGFSSLQLAGFARYS